MAERGVTVAPSTIYCWGPPFVPDFETRWNACRKRIGTSWRVDETYILVNKRWHHPYRAVARQGRTVDFLLRQDLDIEAATAFFQNALGTNDGQAPRKVILDRHVPSHRALQLMGREDLRWCCIHARTCQYLNNIVEQDHRATKRRYAPMMGFKAFHSASGTIAGIEPVNHTGKQQFALGHARGAHGFDMRTAWERSLFGAA